MTLVSPRDYILSSAIFAFCPVRSGIVIEDAVAVAVVTDGAKPSAIIEIPTLANRTILLSIVTERI